MGSSEGVALQDRRQHRWRRVRGDRRRPSDRRSLWRTLDKLLSADQVLSAKTATPLGICLTSTNPGTARAWVASILAKPKRGGWATNINMPGSRISMVNCAVKLVLVGTFSFLTTPSRPMSQNLDESLPTRTKALGAKVAVEPSERRICAAPDSANAKFRFQSQSEHKTRHAAECHAAQEA